MNWVKYMAVVIPVVLCVSSCDKPEAVEAQGKKTGAAGGGSVITGNSGSLSIGVSGKNPSTGVPYQWSCIKTDGAHLDDCQTDAPTLYLAIGGAAASINVPIHADWNIEVHPHAAQLEIVNGALHAYANRPNDYWTLSGKTITHNNGSKVARVIITDVTNGRKLYDSKDLCVPASGLTCPIFTIGQ